MKSLWRRFRSTPSPGTTAAPAGMHPDPAVNRQCTEFEVNNWELSKFVVEQLVPIVGVHPFPLPELFLMSAAVCRLRPTHVFEWGTHIGKSARVFYETSAYFGLAVEIHSVDLPPDVDHQEHPGQRRGELVRDISNVTLHLGDGLRVALEVIRTHQVARPLFFVDGDHAYESVARELTGIMEQVPQAQILLHDTFYQSPESQYNVGPHRAIVEALARMPGRYRVMETTTGLPGMTLLYQL